MSARGGPENPRLVVPSSKVSSEIVAGSFLEPWPSDGTAEYVWRIAVSNASPKRRGRVSQATKRTHNDQVEQKAMRGAGLPYILQSRADRAMHLSDKIG